MSARRPRPGNGAALFTVILLAGAFAVSVGQGGVLPFVPGLIERFGAGDGDQHRAEIGYVTAVFFAGALFTPVLWGVLSDRIGRRAVLLAAVAGFAVTLALTPLVASLPALFLLRAVNGAFGAAIAPVTLAAISDVFPEGPARGRRFTWVNVVVVGGYLVGPLLGEVASGLGSAWPFLAPAVAAASTIPVILFLVDHRSRAAPARPNERARLDCRGLAEPLAIAFVAAAGLTAMEVAMAMTPASMALDRRSVSLLLSVCALVMLATQLLQFSKSGIGESSRRLVTPGLVVLGAVLFVEPFMKGLPEMATTVLFAAWSAATLLLLSSYAVSQLSPRAAGLGLGLQFTAATAGQMAGAAGAGAFSSDRRVFVLWAVALAAVALALWRARPRGRVA